MTDIQKLAPITHTGTQTIVTSRLVLRPFQRKSRMVFYIMRDFLYILKWLHGYRVKPQQKKAFKMLLQFFAGSLPRLLALQTETHGMKRAGRRCPK